MCGGGLLCFLCEYTVVDRGKLPKSRPLSARAFTRLWTRTPPATPPGTPPNHAAEAGTGWSNQHGVLGFNELARTCDLNRLRGLPNRKSYRERRRGRAREE